MEDALFLNGATCRVRLFSCFAAMEWGFRVRRVFGPLLGEFMDAGLAGDRCLLRILAFSQTSGPQLERLLQDALDRCSCPDAAPDPDPDADPGPDADLDAAWRERHPEEALLLGAAAIRILSREFVRALDAFLASVQETDLAGEGEALDVPAGWEHRHVLDAALLPGQGARPGRVASLGSLLREGAGPEAVFSLLLNKLLLNAGQQWQGPCAQKAACQKEIFS